MEVFFLMQADKKSTLVGRSCHITRSWNGIVVKWNYRKTGVEISKNCYREIRCDCKCVTFLHRYSSAYLFGEQLAVADAPGKAIKQ